MNRDKIKEGLLRSWEGIKDKAIEVNVWRGLVDFVLINLGIFVLTFFMTGIRNNLFNGYFEAFVSISLILLVFLNIRIKTDNGYIGTANVFYLFMGFLTAYTLNFTFLDLGRKVFFGIILITAIAMIYELIKQRGAKWKKLPTKSH